MPALGLLLNLPAQWFINIQDLRKHVDYEQGYKALYEA
jgi:hypothetical protein